MSAVWLRLRSEFRYRWRAWIGLALLVGFAAGTAMAGLYAWYTVTVSAV